MMLQISQVHLLRSSAQAGLRIQPPSHRRFPRAPGCQPEALHPRVLRRRHRGRPDSTWDGWSLEALRGWSHYLGLALPSVVMICCK